MWWRVSRSFYSMDSEGLSMKIMHWALIAVFVFACIWASNNVKLISNIVG